MFPGKRRAFRQNPGAKRSGFETMDWTRSGAIAADAAVAAIFLLFILWKGRRGLSRSLMPLAVTIASLLGAIFFSRALTPAAAAALLPALEKWLAGRADFSALTEVRLPDLAGALTELLPEKLNVLLEKLGLSVSRAAEDALAAAGAAEDAARTAVDAVVRSIAETLAHVGLFLLIFLLLLLVLSLLRRALGWVFRLPVIRWADVLLGALLGAVECAVLLWIVCAAAEIFDGGRLRAFAEGTRLLAVFAG